MTKERPIETTEDLVNALEALFNQVLMDVPEEADDILREAGYDPDQLGKEMAEFAKQVSAKSPLNWRNKQDQLDQAKTDLRASPPSQLIRSEKEARLRKILENNKQGAAIAFRKLHELSDSDLDSLLADAEFLEKKRHHKPDEE